MKLKFIFLGKKNIDLLESIINKYLTRLNHYVKSEFFYLSEKNNRKLEEKILSFIKPNEYFVVLDEHGELLSTLEYADFLKKKINNSSSIIFLVGDAYGVPKTIINQANYLMSMSKMTLPHLIARLMIIEQTYRVFTILNNHPYHHA